MLSWLPEARRLYSEAPKDEVDKESDEARRYLGMAIDDDQTMKRGEKKAKKEDINAQCSYMSLYS